MGPGRVTRRKVALAAVAREENTRAKVSRGPIGRNMRKQPESEGMKSVDVESPLSREEITVLRKRAPPKTTFIDEEEASSQPSKKSAQSALLFDLEVPIEPRASELTETSTMTTMVSVPSSFEKLDEATNYMDWRFAMEAHLFNCDLWEYVDGSKIDAHQNKRARGAIISGIKSHLFSSIRDATSGKEIWRTLEKLYQSCGIYREVALLEDLTSIEYTDCPDMETYINKKITAAQRLRAIDADIKDRLLAGLILMKLPEEFSPLIQSITQSEVTTELVKERLLSEAARQASQKRESALMGLKLNYGYRGHGRRQVRGGRVDHGRSQPSRARSYEGLPQCFKCGKHGHLARNCWRGADHGKVAYEAREERSAEARDSNENQTEFVHFERVLVCPSTARVASSSPFDWFIDSGASLHMTGQRSCFFFFNQDARTRFVTNNEILQSAGLGDVRISCYIGGKCQNTRLRDVLYVPGHTVNLVSVKQLTKKGLNVVFKDKKCEILAKEGMVCATACCTDTDLHRLQACSTTALTASTYAAYDLWLRRLGHLGPGGVKKLAKGLVKGVDCVVPDTSKRVGHVQGGSRGGKNSQSPILARNQDWNSCTAM